MHDHRPPARDSTGGSRHALGEKKVARQPSRLTNIFLPFVNHLQANSPSSPAVDSRCTNEWSCHPPSYFLAEYAFIGGRCHRPNSGSDNPHTTGRAGVYSEFQTAQLVQCSAPCMLKCPSLAYFYLIHSHRAL